MHKTRFSSQVRLLAFLLTAPATITIASPSVGYGSIVPLQTTTNLSWGPGGDGGDGVWNALNYNWWSGSAAVRWTAGRQARFAGPGGTVHADNPKVSQITFAEGEYRLTGDALDPAGSLRFICETDGWVDVNVIWASSGSATVYKNGPATLHLGSSLFFAENLNISEGALRITSSRVGDHELVTNLANADGIELILAAPTGAITLGGLTGGESGGIVRADNLPISLSLASSSDRTHVFHGRLLDGPGGAQLSLTKSGAFTQVLREANLLSGGTSVSGGSLQLTGGGTLQNSPIRVSGSGTLLLDNHEQPISGRIPALHDMTMVGGNFHLLGHSGTSIEERAAKLRFSRAANVVVESAPDGPVTFHVEELIRENHGVFTVSGSGALKVSALPEGRFLGPAILRNGSDWGMAGGDGEILAFADYTLLPDATSGDHVNLSGSANFALDQSTTVASLRAFRSTGAAASLNLAGESELHLETGGILLTGGGHLTIDGGSVSAGAEGELLAHVDGTLALHSSVTNSTPGTHLTKAGPGRLELRGSNTYTGNTVLTEGTVWAANESALGMGEAITFAGGTLALPGPIESTKTLVVPAGGRGSISVPTGWARFSGLSNAGSFSISGNGGLHLTEPGVDLGAVTAVRSKLAASEVTGQRLALVWGAGADLSGRLDYLIVSSSDTPAVLSIGGDALGLLEVDFLSASGGWSSGALVIEYNLGSEGGDLLKLGEIIAASEGEILVRPLFPESLEPGLRYPIVEFQDEAAQYLKDFRLDPALYDAGWRGSIVAEEQILYLMLCSTPDMEMTIAEALDVPGLTWTSGGPQEWSARLCGYQPGSNAVSSGPVQNDPMPTAESWLETSVRGPGLLSFKWQASGGHLELEIGGQTIISTDSAPRPWREIKSFIPPGPQTVRWRIQTQWQPYLPYPELDITDVGFEPRSFDSWTHWNGISGPAADPNHDPDGSGASNLLRYALGIQPGEPVREGLPRHSLDRRLHEGVEADFLSLIFERRRYLSDVSFHVESSENLTDWTLVQGPNTQTIEPTEEGFERVTVRDTEPVHNHSARFLRLRVSQSP